MTATSPLAPAGAPVKAHPSKITNATLKAAKAGTKPVKVSVGGGLHLLISVSGSKTWNWAYRAPDGRQRTLKIGVFPHVDLGQAQADAYAARLLLDQGLDPVAEREKLKLQTMAAQAQTLGALCGDWLDHRQGDLAPYTAWQQRTWLTRYVIDRPIGGLPVAEVSAAQVHQLVKGVASGEIRTGVERKNGSAYIATKIKQMLHSVMAYGISTGALTVNVVAMIETKHAVKTVPTRHNKALAPADVRDLLARVDSCANRLLVVRTAVALTLLTGCRTMECLAARWGEFDLENGLWALPASRMKNKQVHDFPLSAQLIARLKALRDLSPKTGALDYVFASPKGKVLPHLSRGAINAVYSQLGLDGDSWFRAHGCRGSITSWAYESGAYRREVIERYLSHVEKNKVVAAYTTLVKYLPERRILAQDWANLIDPPAVVEQQQAA
jgi:integrase